MDSLEKSTPVRRNDTCKSHQVEGSLICYPWNSKAIPNGVSVVRGQELRMLMGESIQACCLRPPCHHDSKQEVPQEFWASGLFPGDVAAREWAHSALPMCHAMFILLCILIVCVYLFIYLLYCPFYLNASFTEWFLYCWILVPRT